MGDDMGHEIRGDRNYVMRWRVDGWPREVERSGADVLAAYWEAVNRDPSSAGYDAGDAPVTLAHVRGWLTSYTGAGAMVRLVRWEWETVPA